MASLWSDYRLFFREFRRTFHTTGAVLPSGRSLAKALATYVRQEAPAGAPRRILEVGPGTGAVTARIVRDLRDGDRLDLVELNETFVARLRERFAAEPDFQRVAERAAVLHQNIAELDTDAPYDVVISGLPLNNFSTELVEELLAVLVRLVKPGGSLSFFEYIAIRNARAMVGSKNDRQRLRGISAALGEVFQRYPCRRQWIWPNVPPAWVHHVLPPSKS